MMLHDELEPLVAWAEDRATQRCDPSADPGAKTEGRAVRSATAATLPAGCPSILANAERQEFQFPVNQQS